MDFNDLYGRQQVSLMRADAAACDASREAHHELARLYGARIAGKKADRGTTGRPQPFAPMICDEQRTENQR